MGSLSHIIFLYIIQFSAEKSKVEKKRGNMDIYSSLLEAIEQEYAPVRSLKEGARGSVSVVRHRKSGRRYVFPAFFRQRRGLPEAADRALPPSTPDL